MSDDLKAHLDAPDDAWVAYWHTRYTTLLAAVEGVREEFRPIVGSKTKVNRLLEHLWTALTRIIDQHECPLNTDISASVTKPVGTGSGTKAVTMTPDEYRHWRTI